MSNRKECSRCHVDSLMCIDNTNSYTEICGICGKKNVYDKIDIVDSFECPNCGSISGTTEENKHKFGIRCDRCGQLFIQFEKSDDTIDNRHKVDTRPKCPHCGSTNISKISTTSRMISTGLFGLASSKIGKTMECKKCGYKW